MDMSPDENTQVAPAAIAAQVVTGQSTQMSLQDLIEAATPLASDYLK